MRRLATIRLIADIQPIEGADNIDVATVDGWKVVVKKGEFTVGDLVCYFEIDSWIPYELAPFLVKNAAIPREYNGVKGERLRTIKLRGQVSQGLLLPLSVLGNYNYWRAFIPPNHWTNNNGRVNHVEGADATEYLGIQKWEAPIPAQLQGQAVGMFPTSLIPKTDQERIQNCFGKIKDRAKRSTTETVWDVELGRLDQRPVVIPADFKEPTYEVTMKLDGSSCTIFRWEGELRVCSRNLELKINEENADNTFVAIALKIGNNIPEGFAFQGEMCGPGIQGNREGFKDHKFFVFDVYSIDRQVYATPFERQGMVEVLELEHVPVLGEDWLAPNSVEEGLALAEGPSINHKIREGLVWKCNEDPSFSFKIINNTFLLKGGD